MKAEFTSFPNDTNWVEGVVGMYKFQAKLFDEGSTYGINNGRVSKLSIWDEKARWEKQNFFDACIMNYDRGWDIEVDANNQEYQEAYSAVMELLENSPKRFENE